MNHYEFEQALKRYIRADGRSQAAVARKLGYSPDTFNKWIRGVNRMPSDVLADLCDLLSLDPQIHYALLELAGYRAPVSTVGKTPDAVAGSGILFATRIMPDGKAIDPGTTFRADVVDLYAVFPAHSVLPGTFVDAPQVEASAYYAYLKLKPDSHLRRLGWRWYYKGEIINDFEMDIKPESRSGCSASITNMASSNSRHMA